MYRKSARTSSPSTLIIKRDIYAPERTAGNNEHAGGMRGKDNI